MFVWGVIMGRHDLKVCSYCSRSFKLVFRDLENVGVYAHWEGKNYFVDVIEFIEGYAFCLFRECWALE